MKIHPPYPLYKFFRESRTISPDCLEYAIDASILAYSDKGFVQDILRLANLQPNFFSAEDFHAIVTRQSSEEPWLVAFRGTLGISNWWTDIEFAKNKQGFHEGFYHAVDVMLPKIMPTIKGQQVVFTGHSLGAAMAAIAAARTREICEILHVLNFGQPKIGNANATHQLDGLRWTRVVHAKDIVARVPPDEFDFVHSGAEILLEQTPRPFFGSLSTERPFYIPLEIWDHVPTLYAEKIWTRRQGYSSTSTKRS